MARAPRLILPAGPRAEIEAHALRSLPEEACGVLLGSIESNETSVMRVVAEENIHPGDRRHRYSIAPQRLLAVQKKARNEGLEVVGYYHSHPDSPARPSPTDLHDAWPHLSYVIFSVVDGSFRSWRLDSVAKKFREETVPGLQDVS